jgi:hypothetical protein
MQRLYQVTVAGLEVRSDWRVVHDRLLDEFAEVTDVLATTMNGTILIVYVGSANADAWLQTVSRTVLHLRQRRGGASGRRLPAIRCPAAISEPSGRH